MRVWVFPADEAGCGNYRLRWPAEALIAAGHDVRVVGENREAGALRIDVRVDDGGTRTVERAHPMDVDVVVLQRPARPLLVDAIPHIQAAGVAVVVEIDDDFSCIPPHNLAWRDFHPRYSPGRNYEHLRRAAQYADLVVVSTRALAGRYGAHGRVRVIENHIPARYLDVTSVAWDGLRVGWSGSVATHPGDLEVTRGAVARSLGDARFWAVGTGEGVATRLGLPADRVDASGWLPIDDYPDALARMDVGVVPLADHRFNAAKSWLKGLEMAALGVPFVASPAPEYTRLAKLGAGVLAGRPRVWERALRALLGSADARAELAARGRAVAAAWTIEAHADRWWDAWMDALTRHRSRRRAA